MAVIRVQTTGKFQTASYTDPLSANFPAPPTTGNLLVWTVAASGGNTAFYNFSDNKGNTWALAVNAASAGQPVTTAIGYLENVPFSTGTFTCSFTFGGGGNRYTMQVDEWSGLLTAGVLDQTGAYGPSGVGTSHSVATGGATAQANELVVAVAALYGVTSPVTITKPGAYTEDWIETVNASFQTGESCHLEAVSTGVQTAAYTTNNDWMAGAIATFKASGAAAPTVFPPFPARRNTLIRL